MSPGRPSVPQPARSAVAGELVPDRDVDRSPARVISEGSSCPWPQAGESKSATVSRGPDPAPWDMVDEWGVQSFPASDPPANW
jgi:hypothetical protein